MTLLRITPARLNTYAECPRRYHLRYVAKVPADSTPRAHLSLGSSVHIALSRWWDLPREVREPITLRRLAGAEVDVKAVEFALGLLAGAWSSAGYRDSTQAELWLDRATVWLAGYLVRRMPVDRPRGVERTVAFVRGELTYEGRADRIDQDDDGLVVIDYKLGRRPPSAVDAAGSLALAVYAYGAWRTLRAPCTRVELHHLPTDTVVAAYRDTEWLRRQMERADELGLEIKLRQDTVAAGGPADELFPPVVGPLCGSCEFRAHCPEGQARPAEAPWAALDRWEQRGE